jgi:hypothetical protein
MDEAINPKPAQELVQISDELPIEPAVTLPIQRVEKGHFKKGVSANPSGKPKGANTKKTERLKILMDSALVDRWERYLEAMDNLDDKTFVQEYRQLLEFRFPKLQRVDSTTLSVQAKEQQKIKIGNTEFVIN